MVLYRLLNGLPNRLLLLQLTRALHEWAIRQREPQRLANVRVQQWPRLQIYLTEIGLTEMGLTEIDLKRLHLGEQDSNPGL